MDVRLSVALLAILLASLAFWLVRRGDDAMPPAGAPATATSTAVPPTKALQTPTPNLFRLAGTVVGDVRYAIIEAPDGTNELYHLDETVPDLGKLVEIHARSAVFVSPGGRFVLPLVAAPSATPAASTPTPEVLDDDFDGGYDDGDGDGLRDEREAQDDAEFRDEGELGDDESAYEDAGR